MPTKIKTYHVMTSDEFKAATLYSLQDLKYNEVLSHEDLINNILIEMQNLLTQFNGEDYYTITQKSLKGLNDKEINSLIKQEITYITKKLMFCFIWIQV